MGREAQNISELLKLLEHESDDFTKNANRITDQYRKICRFIRNQEKLLMYHEGN